MHKNTKQQHLIDILFLLSLFCVFAISSVILILFGADIYRKTVSQMDTNYTARTSIAYLSEKIRQSDSEGSIIISQYDETDILMLTTDIDGITYATSLYEYNGYLYELFSRTDIELPLDAGQPVMEIKNLNFKKCNDTLLKISFYDATDSLNTLYINTHSAAQKGS